jgi:predicted phosphoribosyltransferase
VAAEVARILNRPLDVVVVRKLGHPRYREYAVGALAQGDVVVLDQAAIDATNVVPGDLEEIIAEEKARLHEYQTKFGRSAPDFAGKAVILVDDGLATGATMEAAALSARKGGAGNIKVAVPVASESACARLERLADTVLALSIDPAFEAVGRYYDHFPQTTDEEVTGLLQK